MCTFMLGVGWGGVGEWLVVVWWVRYGLFKQATVGDVNTER